MALTIAAAVALILLLFSLDSLFNAPPLAVNPELNAEDYADLVEKHRLEYSIWAIHELRAHFEWNLRSTKYLFWISVLVTLSGIAFAFWQFAKASQFDAVQREHDEVQVKTEMASLSFKSRSIASLVLFVSIIYLLVYVTFIYPIQFTEPPNQPVAEPPDTPPETVDPQPPLPPQNQPVAEPPDTPPETVDPQVPIPVE